MADAVRIARLASGGDGIGRLGDGRTVFVPRTAPGDLVEITEVRSYRRFARARVGRLLAASADRVEPRCPHYTADECGGCQLQHLSPPAQLAARRSFVGEALRRIAKRETPDPEITPAERVYDYRTKLTLTSSRDGRRIGLHPYGRPAEVFDLAWCHIVRPELMMLWAELRQLRPLFPRRLEQVVLRQDRAGGRHVVFRTASGTHRNERWDGRGLQAALCRRGQPAAVWWQREGEAAQAAAEHAEAFSVTAFEQVHPEMGDRVRELAVAALGDVAGQTVWDLYAGVGETTARLVHAGAAVESVESDREAIAAAEARTPGATYHCGRVEDVLAMLWCPDLVITNPPRTGMHERVTAALDRLGPRRIVYISCDPATLARDLTRLPRYRLTGVRAFDLFPQTAHVETVATLESR